MQEELFDKAKQSILSHIQEMFEEMEQEMVTNHQEKYSLLEDLFQNAVHPTELRVAFDQWYNEHAEDIDFEHSMNELWGLAIAGLEE